MGKAGTAVLASLPGNPYAAATTLREIVMPAIRRIAGMTTLRSPIHFGVAGFEYRKMAGRTEFIPVSVEGRDSCDRPILKMLDRGSAGRLLPLSVADGVAVLPEDVIEIVDGLKLAYTPLV